MHAAPWASNKTILVRRVKPLTCLLQLNAEAYVYKLYSGFSVSSGILRLTRNVALKNYIYMDLFLNWKYLACTYLSVHILAYFILSKLLISLFIRKVLEAFNFSFLFCVVGREYGW